MASKKISDLPAKLTLAAADEFTILDSEDAVAATKNKRISKANALIGLPTTDQKAALDGANTPSSTNVFATMADVGGGGSGDATSIQGFAVTTTDPVDGNILVYRTGSSAYVMEPKPSSSGTPAAADVLFTATGTIAATNVQTAIAEVASEAVQSGGALGTPSSGTLTNCTGLPNAGVVGLGSAALTASTAYATAAQGSTADSATQPGDDAADLGSGAATDGYVLTADGAGGAAWEISATSTGIASLSVTADAAAGVLTLPVGASTVTLDGNVELAVPTPGASHDTFSVYLVQDATGGRTVAIPGTWLHQNDLRYLTAPGTTTRLEIRSSTSRVDVTAYALSGYPTPPDVTYAGAWGLRRIVPAYAGALIQVRRTIDGALIEVPATTSGALDIDYLEAYLQGGTGTIAKIYGQVSGAGDFVQATTTKQPAFTRAGLLANAIATFDGTDDSLELTSGGALAVWQAASYGWQSAFAAPTVLTAGSARYIFFCSKGDSATLGRMGLMYDTAVAGQILSSARRLDADTFTSVTTTAIGAVNLWQSTVGYRDWSQAKGYVYVDGAVKIDGTTVGSSGTTSNTASLAMAIGSQHTVGAYAGLKFGELIVGNTSLSAANALELDAAHRRFWLPVPAIPFGLY